MCIARDRFRTDERARARYVGRLFEASMRSFPGDVGRRVEPIQAYFLGSIGSDTPVAVTAVFVDGVVSTWTSRGC